MAIYEGKKITMNVTAHTSEAAYADEVAYDNTESGLEATDVQAAIDELNSKSGEAENVSYDNTESGLEATDVQAAVDEVKAKVDTKADTDGSYEGMTVGNAEQLISKVGLSDKSPYLFRTAGGSLEIGNRSKVKKIVGASVPIIQRIRNNFASSTTKDGITFTNNNDGSWTLNGTAEAQTYITIDYGVWNELGKVYMYGFSNLASAVTGVRFVEAWGTGGTGTMKIAPLVSDNVEFRLYVENGTQVNNLKVIPIAFNLTNTFGATVANRLYALEQAQEGSGIAKAKEILVKEYYPYNVTAFTHTKTSGKQNTGFNQLKTQPVIVPSPLPSFDITKVTRVIAGDSYCLHYNNTGSGRIVIISYDLNGVRFDSNTRNVIGNKFYHNNGGGGYDTYSADFGNSNEIISFAYDSYIMVYYTTFTSITDMNLNLHWDGERDGEYEPYQEWNYPTEDRELKGVLSLDAQDNWVADGDEYLPSGVVDENYGELSYNGTNKVTIDGTEYNITNKSVLSIGGGNYVFYFDVANQAGLLVALNTVPHRDNYGLSNDNPFGTVNGFYAFSNSNDLRIALAISGYTSVAEYDTLFASRTLSVVATHGTPTTSSADPYTELQNDSNWGTEKWIDTRDVPMPVFSEAEYLLDVLAKVEAAPESPTADGDYVMHRANGKNTYTSIASWLSSNGYAQNVVPTAPTTDGNYVLKCTIANGVATYSWEAQS